MDLERLRVGGMTSGLTEYMAGSPRSKLDRLSALSLPHHRRRQRIFRCQWAACIHWECMARETVEVEAPLEVAANSYQSLVTICLAG